MRLGSFIGSWMWGEQPGSIDHSSTCIHVIWWGKLCIKPTSYQCLKQETEPDIPAAIHAGTQVGTCHAEFRDKTDCPPKRAFSPAFHKASLSSMRCDAPGRRGRGQRRNLLNMLRRGKWHVNQSCHPFPDPRCSTYFCPKVCLYWKTDICPDCKYISERVGKKANTSSLQTLVSELS